MLNETANGDKRMSQSKVPIEAIRGLITDALAAAGLPREDAAKCAELMGEADLTGADAHGVFRLPQYVRRLKAGGFNPKPNITVQRRRRPPRWSMATTRWAIW